MTVRLVRDGAAGRSAAINALRGGGIAVLANVRQLIEEHGRRGHSERGLELEPELEVSAAGPAAVLYDRRYVEFGKIEDNVIDALNRRH